MGRTARGVIGVKLNGPDDEVIGMDTIKENGDVLSVCENGIGKRTPVELYKPQKRGGAGSININITKKTGVIIGLKVVRLTDELMLITNNGTVIRQEISGIRVTGKNTQGVKLMEVKDDSKIASLARINNRKDADTDNDDNQAIENK